MQPYLNSRHLKKEKKSQGARVGGGCYTCSKKVREAVCVRERHRQTGTEGEYSRVKKIANKLFSFAYLNSSITRYGDLSTFGYEVCSKYVYVMVRLLNRFLKNPRYV